MSAAVRRQAAHNHGPQQGRRGAGNSKHPCLDGQSGRWGGGTLVPLPPLLLAELLEEEEEELLGEERGLSAEQRSSSSPPPTAKPPSPGAAKGFGGAMPSPCSAKSPPTKTPHPLFFMQTASPPPRRNKKTLKEIFLATALPRGLKPHQQLPRDPPCPTEQQAEERPEGKGQC